MYIGEAAQRSGTTVKTIRHYEAIGLLPTARRQGRYRVYDLHSIELLSFIKCAKEMGFTLMELQRIFCAHHGRSMPWELAQQAIEDKKRALSEKIAMLARQHEQLQAFEANLQQARDECPLEKL